MGRTLKITSDNHLQVVEVDFNSGQDMEREIGGTFSAVYSVRLRAYLDKAVYMIVDRDGRLKGLPMNPTGCYFHRTLQNGLPLVGDFFLAVCECDAAGKKQWRAPDEAELEEWAARLKKDFWLTE